MRPGGHRCLHGITIPTGAASTTLRPLHSLRHRRRSLLRFPYDSFFPLSAFLLSSLARCLRGSMNPEAKTMTAPGVAVRDPESLEKKKAAIRSAGPGKVQVLLFLFLLNPSALEPFTGSEMFDLLDVCETLRWLLILTARWLSTGWMVFAVKVGFIRPLCLVYFGRWVWSLFQLCLSWSFSLLSLASHGLLQQGNQVYDAKRQALYEYYHPLEISPDIPIEEKTKLMEEWYANVLTSVQSCIFFCFFITLIHHEFTTKA